jgi:hypothetical protein
MLETPKVLNSFVKLKILEIEGKIFISNENLKMDNQQETKEINLRILRDYTQCPYNKGEEIVQLILKSIITILGK